MDYQETKTCQVMRNQEWKVDTQLLWSLFVASFKAKTEEELAEAVIGAIDDLDGDKSFKESLGKALVSDLKACLKKTSI